MTTIRRNLSSLDSYINRIDSDIEKFNVYVKTQRVSLLARGETTNDLLVNLFKGYHSASDREFIGYIIRKEDSYNEGAAMTEDELMQLAENKFKTLSDEGKWHTPTEDQQKIIALTAQISEMQKKPADEPPEKKEETKDANKSKESKEKKD